ncbi:MAG: cysteine--tRNA ligase [Eubacteriales bacterium]|nr:cysteine--tRNA ligase [Eubacteriales bacterium]
MKIYNTLTRNKEEFIPIDPEQIKIYVCGPTVYNYFHIGNARPFVVFDTLRRYLEYKGQNVKFIQNFTDVDDKIINRAKVEGITPKEVADKYIEEYFKDAGALNVKKADVHPRVSEHMDEIIDFVKTLTDKGFAYEANGDVYFSARKFKGYGKLSRQNIDDLDSGSRIEVDDIKRDPLDFALWKARKSEDEIAWKSPWGMGRPGWHIECSAMAKKHLGETIDLHAGGQDLQFPHHENEIAQSECCNGVQFAKYWMHNGYITIDDEKMSKSKGNFFTVRDILKDYDGEVMRFFLLAGHYRNPINFADSLMEQAKNSLGRLRNAKSGLEHLIANGTDEPMDDEEKAAIAELEQYKAEFDAKMEDDLNTADAITALFGMVTAINNKIKNGATKEFAETALAKFVMLANVLGLLFESEDVISDEIKALAEERQQARKDKNFARADEIRDILKERGYSLKDTQMGVQIIKD